MAKKPKTAPKPPTPIVVLHGAPQDNSVSRLEESLLELQANLEGEAYKGVSIRVRK